MATALVAACWGLSSSAAERGGPTPADPSLRGARGVPTPSSLPVLGPVPAFSYLDQEGRALSDRDLLGRVWIAGFIFTSCTNVCPMLTARMAMLQRRLVDPGVRFISFSVDPVHDTPAVLKAYAARWRRDEPRWRLLATTQQSVRALAQGMKAEVAPGLSPDEPLAHSSEFALVDASGFIRGSYPSEGQGQLDQLLEDATALARGGTSPPAPVPGVAPDGRRLALELGCAGCHADPRLAPALEGLYGQAVALDDDRTVVADLPYLRESLLDPDAKVVDGYPTTMPSYAGQLTESQLEALLVHLRSLAIAVRTSAPRHRALDPVCRMEVSAGPETLQVPRDGGTVYFCSDICRRRFLQDPALYPTAVEK